MSDEESSCGRFSHRYPDGGDTCSKCGHVRQKRTSSRREAKPARKAQGGLSQREVTAGLEVLLKLAEGVAVGLEPRLDEDRLTVPERRMLASAIAEELWSYERAREWVQKAAKLGGAHSKLLLALLFIALPRLSRHGVLPEEFGGDLAATALSLASGGAPQPDRGDGEREVDLGEGFAWTEEVPSGAPDENGRHRVPSSSGVGTGGNPEQPPAREG